MSNAFSSGAPGSIRRSRRRRGSTAPDSLWARLIRYSSRSSPYSLVNEEAKETGRTCQHVYVAWLDTVVLNLTPMLIVMSVLASFVVHPGGLWRGIGGAWLAVVVIAFAIAVLYPDYWSLDCGRLGLNRTLFGPVTVTNPSLNPCEFDNSLPLWLIALPPLIGIVILMAWVWRHTRPSPEAMRTIGILTGSAILAVLVGQLNENLALPFVVAVAAAAYALPRLQRQQAA
jgi:hypothetical protein